MVPFRNVIVNTIHKCEKKKTMVLDWYSYMVFILWRFKSPEQALT